MSTSGFLAMGVGAVSFDPDVASLLGRMTTRPSAARALLINDLILGLKSAGVWSKLDVLYVRAAHDEQAARLNWVANQYNSTAVAGPVFTVDRGYTPDGVASYLDSDFNPMTVASPKFLQDNGHMGAWHLTDLANGAGVSFDLGSGNSRIGNSAAAQSAPRPNTNIAITAISDNYAKHKVWTRDGASSWRYYNDGALVGGDPRTDASTTLSNFAFCTGRTSTLAYGLNQEAAAHWGAHLTTAEILATRNALAAYLTAVGAA